MRKFFCSKKSHIWWQEESVHFYCSISGVTNLYFVICMTLNVFLGVESDVQIVSPAEPLKPFSSTNNNNLEQEKGNQDHDINEPISSSKLRSIPAQDKLNVEIDQMTKKIEVHKAGLDAGIVENREETMRVIKSLSAEREKCLKKKLVLQNDAERKKKV